MICAQYSRPAGILGGPCLNCGGSQPEHVSPERFAQESARTPWIITFSGRRVNPLDLQLEDIDIVDIAHHLATINRWCGALREPISVAQHSVHVSHLCEGSGYELDALLHDASEAYLGEVTKWLKNSEAMSAYREAEDRATAVICQRFGLQNPLPAAVEEADKLMVGVEGRFGIADWRALPGYELPTPETLKKARFEHKAWSWHDAEVRFMLRFGALC